MHFKTITNLRIVPSVMEDKRGFTQEALNRLDEAIAGGARSITLGDKTISFHSLDELIRLRNQIATYLITKEPKRQFYPRVSKGL